MSIGSLKSENRLKKKAYKRQREQKTSVKSPLPKSKSVPKMDIDVAPKVEIKVEGIEENEHVASIKSSLLQEEMVPESQRNFSIIIPRKTEKTLIKENTPVTMRQMS